MAEQQQQDRGVELDHHHFCCSVCLELLREPVALPCGHNYCKSCIEGCWDQDEGKGRFSCPQCREAFSPRPELRRNHMLAEVVEKLKKSSPQQASPPAAVARAGPADVPCDFCCETRQNKATMSCLTCLASYCPAHLEPHHSVPVLKKHRLVSATIPLQEKMCTRHNKLMEVYCQTDRKCICYLCIIDEHKNHRTVSAAAERDEEQKQLIESQKKIQDRFQEREKELNELVKLLKDFKSSHLPAVKTCDKIFDMLNSSIKRKRTLVKQLITDRKKTAVAQAEKLQLQLEEEITELRRRDTELEQLAHMDDHIHFIQTFGSLSAFCESPDLPLGCVVRPELWFETVTDCVSKLRDDMENLLKDTWPRISVTVSAINVVLPPVPKTREEFLRYCCPLTLDENSVSAELSISQEYLRVTSKVQSSRHSYYYEKPSVQNVRQVLCREGLSERCYWEVSLSYRTWSVAVSYKDISGTKNSEFGTDDKSWSLACSQYGYCFGHDEESMTVSGPQNNRIGVFLDYKAGCLSFYSISDTMTLLHKVCTTFTEPLYPGLGLKDDGSQSSNGQYAELIKLW